MVLCIYFGCDWYLFKLIVLLKQDFNCWSNFALSWIDNVTTGTSSFVSAIENIPAPVELVTTQADSPIKMRLAS